MQANLGLMTHSRSILANQKARNAIVGAENLLKENIIVQSPAGNRVSCSYKNSSIIKVSHSAICVSCRNIRVSHSYENCPTV